MDEHDPIQNVNSIKMKKIQTALIIGLGSIGMRHLGVITELFPNIKIIALRHNPESCNEMISGVSLSVSNLQDAISEKPDIAIIANPASMHLSIAIELAMAGIHLLIEKPITLNSNDLLKNIKKSSLKRKIIQAGYNLKYDSGLNYIKKNLSSKVIGKIYYCKISYANGTARSNSNNVGSIFDMASHSVNLLMWLFNSKVLKIINSYNQKNEFSKIHPDNGFAILKAKDILINLHHGFCNWKNIFSIEVYARQGSLKVCSLPKWGDQTVIIEKRVLPSGNPKVKIKKFKYDLSFKNELHSLLETIRGINKSKKSVIKQINYESYYTLKNTILLK